MRKFGVLVKIIFMLLSSKIVYGSMLPAPFFVKSQPLETIVIQLPSEDQREWKELSRMVTQPECMVEYIPSDQKVGQWSELIALQYFSKSRLSRRETSSIDEVVALIKDSTFKAYPGKKVTWTIIERNATDIIYEWILHTPYKKIPPQHELVRIFMRDEGIHRIGFTRQHDPMSPDERDKWIDILKNNISLQSLDKVSETNHTLSLAYYYGTLFRLDPFFNDWEITQSESLNSGLSSTLMKPPALKDPQRYESLELKFICEPLIRFGGSFEKQISDQKYNLELRAGYPIEIHWLKKSPQEAIVHFVVPFNLQVPQMDAIERYVVNESGGYMIKYHREGLCRLKTEEIHDWKERLEKINISKR